MNLAWRLAGVVLTGAVLATGASAAAAPAPPVTLCDQAAELETLGRSEQALSTYTKALATADQKTCGERGVRRLEKDRALCATAERLNANDERSAAHAAYLTILKAAPKSECAAAGVKHTRDDTWSTIERTLKHLATVLGIAAAVVSVILLGLSLLQALLARVWLVRSLPLVRRLRRPQLVLDQLGDSGLDQKLGSTVTTLMRARIGRSPTVAINRIDLASGEAQPSGAVAAVAELSPQAKVATELWESVRTWVRPIRFRSSGELQREGANGVGVLLALTGRRSAEGELWSSDAGPAPAVPPGADDFRRLAIPAAAWLEYQILHQELQTTTKSGASWAAFQTAVWFEGRNDTGTALELYRRAVQLDPDNHSAHANELLIRIAKQDTDAVAELLMVLDQLAT